MKTTTYFTSIFSKLRVSDKEIRQKISELYGGLIDTILQDVSEGRRTQILKFVTLTIKDTISYLKGLQKVNQKLDPPTLKALSSTVNLTKKIISDIGLRSAASNVANRILNEAFIADIGCDIGACVRDFKKTSSLRNRIEILQRLKTLVDDYNVVQQTELTVRDVLEGKSTKK